MVSPTLEIQAIIFIFNLHVDITERFATCGCTYYSHAVDPCSKNGIEGHQIQKRSVAVLNTCPRHTSSSHSSPSDPHNLAPEESKEIKTSHDRLGKFSSSRTLNEGPSRFDSEEAGKESYWESDVEADQPETLQSGQQTLDYDTNHPLQEEKQNSDRAKKDVYVLPSLLFSVILTIVNLFALTNSLQVWLQISGIHLLNFLGVSYFSWVLSFHTRLDLQWKQNLNKHYRELFRPRLQKGWTRIEWTCLCGDMLYADFIEKTPGSLRKLAQALKGHITDGHVTEDDTSDCAEGFGRQACSGRSQVAGIQGNSTRTSASARSFPVQQEDEPVLPKAAAGSATIAHSETKRRRWLELCIRSGRNTFNLGEIDLVGVQDDQTVFTKIKEKYMQSCQASWLGSWLLRVPSGGIFVELRKDKLISKDQVPTACVMKRNSVPTPEEATLYKYTFCPVPMDEPPMDSRTFSHYFSKPHAAEAISVWTTRFPKLDDASFYYSNERLAKGWGIEITEELNWTLFLVISLILLLLSGLVAGISAYLMDDKSTGVAIGAWLTAVQGLAVAALFFHWSRS